MTKKNEKTKTKTVPRVHSFHLSPSHTLTFLLLSYFAPFLFLKRDSTSSLLQRNRKKNQKKTSRRHIYIYTNDRTKTRLPARQINRQTHDDIINRNPTPPPSPQKKRKGLLSLLQLGLEGGRGGGERGDDAKKTLNFVKGRFFEKN